MKIKKEFRLITYLFAAFLLFSFSNIQAQKIDAKMKPFESVEPKGTQAPNTNFTGTVFVNMIVKPEDGLHSNIGKVTFEPKARTNWHSHPTGQTLIVTEGIGYYQEKGKPIQLIQKGDVVKIPPNVEHWHGASHNSSMTHIAIVSLGEKESAIWLQPVTDKEYNAFI